MRRFGWIAAVSVIAATAVFYALVHQVANLWLDVALSPEIHHALQQSLDDQKALRRLDPEHSSTYRLRFETTRKLLARIDVIRMNRAAVLRRFELALTVAFSVAAAALALVTWLRYVRARERERRAHVERLASWQETARRHAHEIKGPLTAARLEIERLADLARSGAPAGQLLPVEQSITQELDRLTAFTRQFSSFGGLTEPALRPESLHDIAREFCSTFAGAWPDVEIRLSAPPGDWPVCADRDLVRQVLVNLCTNSSHAVDGHGVITLTIRRSGRQTALDVADNGSGIAPALQARIFDPYVTTRKIGSGMGLGLAISRKIMLDHGGDLELVETSPSGTTFRLTFGDPACL